MTKKLKDLRDSIEKQFGAGSVMLLGDKDIPTIEVIETGIFSLDKALGGGFPRGRMVEIYGLEGAGKSSIAMYIAAAVQSKGGIAAYIDAEHSLNLKLAKTLGVKTEELLLSQPDSAEQALELAEGLARSGVVSVIIIDSVAALVPQAEVDAEMSESQMGLQARLIGKACRKLTPVLSKTNTLLVLINQIRHKIGVVYGCLQGETLVCMENGSVPISTIVRDQIKGNVWSLNPKTQQLELKPIIDWHHNGSVVTNTDFIHFEAASVEGQGGKFGFTVTPNHKVLTDTGWKEAKDVTMLDKLISKYDSILNGSLREFMLGTSIGDSTIAIRSENTACVKFQDSNNPEFINWKKSKLASHFNIKESVNGFATNHTYELAKFKKEIVKNRNPLHFLKEEFSYLGLALWFMDDAHYENKEGHSRYKLSVKRFKDDKLLIDEIKTIFDSRELFCSVDAEGTFIFTKEATDRIADNIKQYVPASMQYKLPISYKGQYKEFELNSVREIRQTNTNITEIRFASNRQMRDKTKYDITVADNSNYLVGGITNGVIVHNSPETTPGGNALKYYCSQRLEIRRGEQYKEKDKVIGHGISIKIVKNKIGTPFAKIEVPLIYGKGIDVLSDLVDYAIKAGIIEKAGSWYNYGTVKLGQGKDAAAETISNDDKLLVEITTKVSAVEVDLTDD